MELARKFGASDPTGLGSQVATGRNVTVNPADAALLVVVTVLGPVAPATASLTSPSTIVTVGAPDARDMTTHSIIPRIRK